MHIVANAILVCQLLFPGFGAPCPPAGGLLCPLSPLFIFVLLFTAEGKQSQKAAHTQRSVLDKLVLYSENAVVLGHPFSARKTSQLDKLDTQSNGLQQGKNNLLIFI